MPAVTGPIILTAQEFAAQPLGVDTAKLLKAQTTLSGAVIVGATSITLADSQGSAPARFDPRVKAIPSYAIVRGDIIFIGAGTTADPMEWTVATGDLPTAAPYSVNVQALTYAHPSSSPVSVGTLQQELLSAALAVERHCQQPLTLTTHPDDRWPEHEFRLGQFYFVVDARGYPTLFVPYAPIVSSYTPTLQYKTGAGSAVAWTSADITTWEVLSDRLVGPQGTWNRGDFVLAKLGWQSGYATVPDDAKEAHRIVAAEYLRRRGGQAVVQGSGRRIASTSEKDVEIPAAAKDLLRPFVRVR